MSAVDQIKALAQAIGADVKQLRASIGTLGVLNTQQKDSLVLAINELHSLITASTQINDAASSADTTYSSDKILQLFIQFKDQITNGATTAYDTLGEIQAAMSAEDGAIAGLLSAIGNRVAFDQVQTLTTQQQTQARSNIGAASAEDLSSLTIGLGDLSHNFVTDYTSALA